MNQITAAVVFGILALCALGMPSVLPVGLVSILAPTLPPAGVFWPSAPCWCSLRRAENLRIDHERQKTNRC